MLETCKLCNKEWKNLGAHVRAAHHITLADYHKTDAKSNDTGEFAEIDETVVEEAKVVEEDPIQPSKAFVSLKEQEEGLFTPKKFDSNRPLSEFLREFDMDER